MKRAAVLLGAWLTLSGCFRFDDKLAACRNDAGVWICGAVADAGADGGGGASAAGLICQSDGGWCWEHPRPAGGRWDAVWASAPNELWVGTQFGLVLRRTDAGWSATPLGDQYAVTDLCGHEGTVYAGTTLDPTATANRLFSLAQGVATPVGSSADEVHGLSCGASSLWVAHDNGLWRMPWGGAIADAVTVADRRCVSVVETDPAQAFVLCNSTDAAVPFVDVIDRSDVLITSFTPDASQQDGFHGVELWRGGEGSVWVALSGTLTDEVWTRDAGTWWPASEAVQPISPLAAAATWKDGWLAVGAFGAVVEFEAGALRKRVVPTVGMSAHRAVTGLPTGEAWVTGEPGCLLERQRDGRWTLNALCGAQFLDVALTDTETLAITDSALYQRQDTGWSKLRDVSGGYGVWVNPDGGGRAILTDDALEYRGVVLSFTVTAARQLAVLDGTRVVVATEDGGLHETSLLGSGGNGPVSNFTVRQRLLVDRTTRTFWAFDATGVRSSSVAGQWDDVPFDGGVIDDLSAGFGQVWLVSSGVVHVRDGSGWRPIVRPARSFNRVAAIDANRAFAFENGGSSEVLATDGTSTPFDTPPFEPELEVEVFGGDLWLLGTNGLVRHPLPR